MLSPDSQEFLSWLSERGRSPNTVEAYRRDLATYEAWLADRRMTLAEVQTADVETYIAHLRNSNLEPDPEQPARTRKPRSVARSLAAVRGLHRFRLDELGATADPTSEVGAPRLPQSVPKALTEDEIAGLLAAANGETPSARRDRAILEVLYGTGVRISELVGLSLGDLDIQGANMRVLGKGSKERIVPLGRFASAALTEWLAPGGRPSLEPKRWARRGDAEAVFLNTRGGRLSRAGAWGVVRRYGDKAGLGNRLTPHVLRHSCATHMLDRGADIRVVQELLGHASVATTQVYTKVSNERLRAVYESAHPRARASRRPA
ncbi:MAG: tyrosine recombinase XerD [Actinobacteria bacterium]|nr:tyrosine recombinase XerD [Actinomycetota bacterium]